MLLLWYGCGPTPIKWSKKREWKPVVVDIEDYDSEEEVLAVCAWMLLHGYRLL